jgi:hypothetical protein
MISELELDRAFADTGAASAEFLRWVLEQTKFLELADELILLNREQAEAKPGKKPENWWRHWWCRLEDGSESETDIFLVLQRTNSEERIALHIEDKPPHGRFTPGQYLNYGRRAEFMAKKQQYMNYSQFTTILLAPHRFADENRNKVQYFDCIISYEAISKYIPLFGQSIHEAQRS